MAIKKSTKGATKASTKKLPKIVAKNKAKTKDKLVTKKTSIKNIPKNKTEPKIKKIIKPAKKLAIKPIKKAATKIVPKIAPKLETPIEVKTPVKVETNAQVFTVPKKIPSKIKTKEFKSGDYAVYPSHGVGKILDIEIIKVSNQKFEVMTIHFEREKLNIKVPTAQIEKIGIRHLVTKKQMDQVFDILRSGVKKLKGMWSRRAQEYESKINSGDIILLAEVLRDLTRDIQDEERSYSERIIYETAIYRLASEYSAISGTLFEKARDEIVSTAKNKLNSSDEAKEIKPKDDFDEEFDSEEEEEDEDEDGDEDLDEEDDED